MSLTPERADELAAALYDARRTLVPIRPLTEADPDLTMTDGYLVQQRVVRRYLDDGDRVVGYKLGLTSRPMQEMLGVDSPDFAPVMASHVLLDGAAVAVADYIQPRLEAEIALVLGADLSGPDCTPVDVLRATEGAVAALELVDSRVADWKIRLPDTVADMASSGAIVLAGRRTRASTTSTCARSAWCSPATARWSPPARGPRRWATPPRRSPGSSARCTASGPRSPRDPSS